MFSGPWGIVVVRVSWPGHLTLIKKKYNEDTLGVALYWGGLGGLLFSWCLTCSLGLQDVQWIVGTSRGARKLARTPHANKKKIYNEDVRASKIIS